MAQYEIKILEREDYPNVVKLKIELNLSPLDEENIVEWFGFNWENMLPDSDGERRCDKHLKEWAHRQVAMIKDDTFAGRIPKDNAPKKGDTIQMDEDKENKKKNKIR